MVPVIPARHCLLRPWSASDVASLVSLANNPAVARNLTHLFPHPYTERHAHEWVRLNTQPGSSLFDWAIEVDGMLAGGIGIRPAQGDAPRRAEIGYWLGEPFWGRGIATAATEALVEWAFDATDLERLEAAVHAGNPASARVLQKCGFVSEPAPTKGPDRDGRLVDRVMHAKLRPAAL